MAEFVLTDPTGAKYKVTADSMEAATKQLDSYRQDQVTKSSTEEANSAPEWAKPLLAMKDVARVGGDTMSAGLISKGIDAATNYLAGTPGGDAEQLKTQAARDRMGWAGTALDVGLMGRFMPTMVPKAVGAVGGGPAVRTIAGAGAAAGEGAAYGGVNAATHDQDVTEGAAVGAGAGILGNAAGNLINKGKRAFDELRGVNFEAPQYNLKKLPATPTAMDFVNQADTAARKTAATMKSPMAEADQYAKRFGKVADTAPKGMFNKEQRGLMDTIINPDPGTQAAALGGNILSNKMLAGGAGAGAGFASASPAVTAATIAGLLVGGKGAHELALQGPREAVSQLRASVYGRPKFVPPVSERSKVRLGNAARTWVIDENGQLVPGD